MRELRAEIVFVDVDDTLVRSAGRKRIPITSVAERVAALKQAGATPYCWSTGGADYSLLPDEAQCPTFVNADLIAAGLSPFRPEAAAMRAGRLMIELLDDLVVRGESFAFETTLADRGYVRRIATWQAAGYHVTILFLALPSADAAIQRVRERVAQGGHDIPEDVIRRRFATGRVNFETLYKPIVDAWALYDSSQPEPVLLDWAEKR